MAKFKINTKAFKELFTTIKKNIKSFLKKDYGRFKGYQLGIFIIVAVFIVLAIMIKGVNKQIDYSIVVNNDDTDLILLEKNNKSLEKGTKLSSSDLTSGVKYANKTARYILFKKNNSLYLYDQKDGDETTKLVSNIDTYFFTPEDEYVVATDTNDNLYSYHFKGDAEKIEDDIDSLLSYSDKYVLYSKGSVLYLKELNYKKDKRIEISSKYHSQATITKDGKYVIYINKNNELYRYKISNKKYEKIKKDVYLYSCTNDKCSNIVYRNLDRELYYLKGNKNTKIDSDITLFQKYEDQDYITYTTKEDNTYTLYYDKLGKDSIKVTTSDKILTPIIRNNYVYYVDNNGDLYVVKISGSKAKKPQKLLENTYSNLTVTKDGVLAVSDCEDNSSTGTLYYIKGTKAKKVDTDVYAPDITVNITGKEFYYLTDYESLSGKLMLSKNGSKPKQIAKDIYSYTYINDNLLYYLKDFNSSKMYGDLYRYTGGKSLKISEQIKRLSNPPINYKFK